MTSGESTAVPRRTIAFRVAVVAGIVIVFVALGVGAYVLLAPHPVKAVAQRKVDVFSVASGMCLDRRSASGSDVKSVDTVSCSAPHVGEVFHTESLSGDDYPGSASIRSTSVHDCEAAFTGFAGISYQKSRQLSYWWLFPTARSWLSGDRSIVCVIDRVDARGKPVAVTGSLKGMAR